MFSPYIYFKLKKINCRFFYQLVMNSEEWLLLKTIISRPSHQMHKYVLS